VDDVTRGEIHRLEQRIDFLREHVEARQEEARRATDKFSASSTS
jgi:outer membrane murein-binding lipoprotein Lpp